MPKGYSFQQHLDTAKKLQRLAREEMKLKLLKDIRADIAVCRLEGWDSTEYIRELAGLLRDLADGC